MEDKSVKNKQKGWNLEAAEEKINDDWIMNGSKASGFKQKNGEGNDQNRDLDSTKTKLD